jgi:hypothetical protein
MKTKNEFTPNLSLKQISPLPNISLIIYKTFLADKSKEKGTALVAAMGFGLLIVLLASLSIIRAGTNKNNAVVNEKAVEAQAVTDMGVTRSVAFFAKNPTYAEYGKPNTVWSSIPASSGPPEGAYSAGTGGATSCGGVLTANNVNTSTTVNISQVTGQQAVNANDYTKGGYQIKSYELYDSSGNLINVSNAADYKTAIENAKNGAAVGNTFAQGVLTIRGDVNPSANSLASIFTGGTVRSSNQIEVKFPLIKRDPVNIPFPGLWIGNQTTGSAAGQNIDADLMVNGSSCTNVQLDIEPNRKVIISDAIFPPLPTPPTTNVNTYPALTNQTLPSNSDVDNTGVTLANGGTGIYRYVVNSIGGGNNTLTITPGKKVHIYLKGNMSFTGNGGIDYNCATVSGNGQSGVSGTSGCVVEDFRIYASADPTVLGTTPPVICLSGGAGTQGFIFAPDYKVGVNGGSGQNFQGALWIDNWAAPGQCGSNSNQIVVTQRVNSWTNIGLFPQNLPAKVGAVTSVTRQEAN